MSALPGLEDLIQNFANGGWESLAAGADRTPDEKRRREQLQTRISDDVLFMASNPQGRRVLEFILNNSIRRASWHGDLRFSIEQAASYGIFREGQNSIAAMLIAALSHATGGDVTILTTRERGNDNAGSSSSRRKWRTTAATAWRWCRSWFGR
jgi:hypothetical protein